MVVTDFLSCYHRVQSLQVNYALSTADAFKQMRKTIQLKKIGHIRALTSLGPSKIDMRKTSVENEPTHTLNQFLSSKDL